MRPIYFFRFALVACLGIATSLPAQETKQKSVESPPLKQDALDAEEAIQAALDKPLNWNWQDPLSDVVKKLHEQTGLDFMLDHEALDDAGVGRETIIEFCADSLPTRAALYLALQEHDLTWVTIDGAVSITTNDRAESIPLQRVYFVRELIKSGVEESDELIEVITQTIAPDTWTDAGGTGAIELLSGTLVVSQTQHVHDRIKGLLQTWRELKARRGDMEIAGRDIDSGSERARKLLERPVDLNLNAVPLADCLSHISGLVGHQIQLDKKALDEAGVGTDTDVTVETNKLSLKQALGRILRPIELTWVIRHGVICVTTPDAAEVDLSIRFYPADQLALTDPGRARVTDIDGLGDTSNQFIDSIIEVIQQTVSADTWNVAGGAGAVEAILDPPLLVVAQTDEVHEQIAALLARLRRVAITYQDFSANDRAGIIPSAVAGPKNPLRFELYQLHFNKQGQSIFTPEELIKLIQTAIEPNSWSQGDGVFIQSLGGMVAVRHHDAVQTRVRNLLRRIGAATTSSPHFGGAVAGGGGFFSVKPEPAPK